MEEFKILLLDKSNACLGVMDISVGGLDVCHADCRIIFATALLARASKMILAHNHPSGNLKPSKSDIALTHCLMIIGEFLDIEVADHILMTRDSYYSFRKNGRMLQP